MPDDPRFVNPPWVYSPSEVEQWINATYPTHKVGKSQVERSKKPAFLRNIEIVLDLDVEKKEITPSNVFLGVLYKLTGKKTIEEHFELIPTAELFIRGLAQAKFHTMVQIKVDGHSVYEHSGEAQDIRQTIEVLTTVSHQQQNADTIMLKARMDEPTHSTAEITIKRIHSKKEHSVTIRISGEIKEELFHRFLNYLRKHLAVEFTEG